MEWLFHILFLTSCQSLVCFTVNRDGPKCEIMNRSSVLDMESNSAAYYFSRSKASDVLAMDFLRAELKVAKFENIWKQATATWTQKNLKVPDGLREENVIALTAYTIESDLFRSLNNDVRSYGGDLKKYNACFKLKSVHYLLSVALQVLRNNSIGRPVYRGIKSKVSGTLGAEMRFGIFASTSFSKAQAEKFGKATFFVVHTGYGVDLRKFSVYPSEQEVLIPPYEKFKITNWSGGNRYTLKSTGYDGVKVELQSDGSGLKIVSGTKTTKIAWWVWFLTALGTSVFLWG